MRPLPFARLAVLPLLALALVSLPRANGQGAKNVERVKFTTVDGVELHGSFYASAKGTKAPCVLLLHNINGKSQEDGWDRLAEALQKKDFAVLSFDFRGHGNSTSIDPMIFWKQPVNRNMVRGASPKKDTLSSKDYGPGYYRYLVNDIAAAKMFLDRMNDAGQCNSANLILVGAQEGATLGALWLASEMYRFQAVNQFGPLRLDPNPEGKNVVCAVWLNISTALGGQAVPLKEWLASAGKDRKVPMAFLYGAEDEPAAAIAKSWAKQLKGEDQLTKDYTVERGTPKTKLQGAKLLRGDVDTIDKMLIYLTNVIEKVTASEWAKREVEKKAYFWQFPSGRPIPGKTADEKTLNFVPVQMLGLR